MTSSFNGLFIFNLIFLLNFATMSYSISKPSKVPSSAADSCKGIFLSYSYTGGAQFSQFRKFNPALQPYRFDSKLTILNNGLDDLKSWRVFVGFQHEEFLVSVSNAELADGHGIPGSVGNGTVFAGYPVTDLKTANEAAGDLNQMQVQVELVGTQFGVAPPEIPMPLNLSLANDGFSCHKPTLQGKSVMLVCCARDPDFKINKTIIKDFLPPQNGDLSITYDVIRTCELSYWAQVSISSHGSLGHLDNWKLSWEWQRNEFINAMRGAHPSVVDSTGCTSGPQVSYYRSLNFSNVLNCERKPTTIVDLPLTEANDPYPGMVPFCCRDGTVLPPQMDPKRSISAFQMEVYKMPPDLSSSRLTPPRNWRINGNLNRAYQCGHPVRTSPGQFPDRGWLPSNSSAGAVASWRVLCTILESKKASPERRISFSGSPRDFGNRVESTTAAG